ncbi:molybdenum cofactor synthesis domain-containing protein [Methanocaldococcus villosus KIN24-T80]|uniref:Molybdenum cofactor synthesis domain-containing protein n=1 Tax=Methanocaldococcus villosus KIN24-T80 TaxID=1069083 RepID=N6UVM8_9EURY|nr:MogA/MoaB family molybdenum cofactor biosynthesis protein [Methanocaldococcus villosus]ENN96399.1 molybdenum cofactor synthesis domain-containing protein [Methanocaldococcus villosus KIN24-T80]
MHKRLDVRYAIITVSDSRFEKFIKGESFKDESGEFLKNELKAKYHLLIPDEKDMIKGAVRYLINKDDIDCVVLTGGTGIAKRDNTVEAVKEIIEKELEGFKIAFQILSYNEVGFSSILSRATAGIVKDKLVYAIPGSINACKTAVKIIKEESGHIIGHLREI